MKKLFCAMAILGLGFAVGCGEDKPTGSHSSGTGVSSSTTTGPKGTVIENKTTATPPKDTK